MGQSKGKGPLPCRNPRGDRGFMEVPLIYTLHRMSPQDKGGGSFHSEEPMIRDSAPGPSGSSEQVVDTRSSRAVNAADRVAWLGSLLLALAPFALFAVLLALDGLLR